MGIFVRGVCVCGEGEFQGSDCGRRRLGLSSLDESPLIYSDQSVCDVEGIANGFIGNAVSRILLGFPVCVRSRSIWPWQKSACSTTIILFLIWQGLRKLPVWDIHVMTLGRTLDCTYVLHYKSWRAHQCWCPAISRLTALIVSTRPIGDRVFQSGEMAAETA